MLITRLKLDYFGKFSGKEIELKPGINIIYGENEAGKSTLHAFIKGMLFGIERLRGRGAASREDLYTRYLPWDYPGAYGGQMDILVGEKLYRLQRSFHAGDRYFTVTDQETGREIKLKEGHISELIPGLNEAAFRNTISMEQLKARTEAELAAQVRNYIANLSVAKSREVNVEKAIEILRQKKKALESLSYESKLKDLAIEIEEGTEREKKIDSLTSALRDLEGEKIKLVNRLEMLKSSGSQEEKLMGELPAIIEKYHTYNEYIKEYTEIKSQIRDLRAKLEGLDNVTEKGIRLKNDLSEAQQLETDRARYRDIYQHLQKEEEEKKSKSRVKVFLYTVISVILAFGCYGMTKSFPSAMVMWCVLLVIGGTFCIISGKHKAGTGSDAQIRETKELYLKAESRLSQILNKHQVSSLNELDKKQEEYLKFTLSVEHDRKLLDKLSERLRLLEDYCDGLHDTIMLYMRNFVAEEELTPKAMDRLKNVIYEKKKEAADNYNRLQSELETVNIQIEKINWELSLMEDNEERLLRKKAQYEELKLKQQENEAEIKAIDLAINTIRELSSAIHDSFGKELNRKVSRIISEVTNGKYQDIKIDEDLNIKLEWNDKYIILDRLSAGTVDQVYFALRLAVADLMFGKDSMPLFFDDSFALYDDCRIKSALMQIKDRRQVLIFSCQMREKRILEEMGLPFNFIKL